MSVKNLLPEECYATMDRILEKNSFSECKTSMDAIKRMYEYMFIESLNMVDYIKQLEEDNQGLLSANADMIHLIKLKRLELPASVFGKRSHIQKKIDAKLEKSGDLHV